MVLVFIIIFIQKRPQGLFALKGRAATDGIDALDARLFTPQRLDRHRCVVALVVLFVACRC